MFGYCVGRVCYGASEFLLGGLNLITGQWFHQYQVRYGAGGTEFGICRFGESRFNMAVGFEDVSPWPFFLL